jgi:hypothetical protein
VKRLSAIFIQEKFFVIVIEESTVAFTADISIMPEELRIEQSAEIVCTERVSLAFRNAGVEKKLRWGS